MSVKLKKSWRLYLGWGLLGLWLLFICWPYFIKLPVQNESTFLYEGYLVSLGKLPYRDFFDFILPGIFYLVAGLIKLFGVSMVAFRLTALTMILGCIAITLYLARFFLPRKGWLTLGLLLLVFHLPRVLEIQHHLCSAFTGMLAVLCMWHALFQQDHIRPKLLLLAGFWIGLTTLFTQTLGVTLGIALGLYLLFFLTLLQKQSLGRSLTYTILHLTLPALLPIALTFGYFATQGTLGKLWYSTFTFLARGSYAATTTHIYFLDGWMKLNTYRKIILSNGPIALLAFFLLLSGSLPLIGLVWLPTYLLRKRNHPKPALWNTTSLLHWRLLFLWVAGIGFFAAMFSYPNTRMVLWHSWLLYLMAWIAFHMACHTRPQLERLLGGLVTLCVLTFLILSTEKSFKLLQLPRMVSYGTREHGLILEDTPQNIRGMNALFRTIHDQSPPGENLFVYNGAPHYYLLTSQLNPTRFQMLMAVYNTPEQIQETLHDLTHKKPTFIIYDHLDQLDFEQDQRFKKWQHYDYHLHGIETLLTEKYTLLSQCNNLWLFKRKDH